MALREVTDWGTDPDTQKLDSGGFPDGFPAREFPKRIREAIASVARWIQDAVGGGLVTAGTGEAYTLAVTAGDTNWTDGPPAGAVFKFRLHVANGATPTLKVESSPARSLVWPDGSNPEPGSLLKGSMLAAWFKDSSDQFVIVDPVKKSNLFEEALSLYLLPR